MFVDTLRDRLNLAFHKGKLDLTRRTKHLGSKRRSKKDKRRAKAKRARKSRKQNRQKK